MEISVEQITLWLAQLIHALLVLRGGDGAKVDGEQQRFCDWVETIYVSHGVGDELLGCRRMENLGQGIEVVEKCLPQSKRLLY